MDCGMNLGFVFSRFDDILSRETIDNNELSDFLDDLKYLAFGNRKIKMDLLSGSIIERLLALFARNDISFGHRESIFDMFSSLLKCYSATIEEPLIYHFYDLSLHFLDNEHLGTCALRCLASLMRRKPSLTIVKRFLADDGKFLRLLLLRDSKMESHLLVYILNVLLQENDVREKLIELRVYDVVFPNIFSDEIKRLELTLQCLYHIFSLENRKDFWENTKVIERIKAFLGSFYPIGVQLNAAKLLLTSAKDDTVLSDDLFNRCAICLVRCLEDKNEYCRSVSSGLFRMVVNWSGSEARGAGLYYLREMMRSMSSLANQDCDTWTLETDLKTNALLVMSDLLSNNEDARRSMTLDQVTETASAVSVRGSANQVKALLRTLHALSRSINHLKTTFENRQFVAFAKDCLLNETDDNEFLSLACALIANLALPICSSRAYLMDAVSPLATLARSHHNLSVRLNAVWALTNLSCTCTSEVKLTVLLAFGLGDLSLPNEPSATDDNLLNKLLELYRNLYCVEKTYFDVEAREPSSIGNRLGKQHLEHVDRAIELIKRGFQSNRSTYTNEVALNLIVNVCAAKNCHPAVIGDGQVFDFIAKAVQNDKSYTSCVGAVNAMYYLLCSEPANEEIRRVVKTASTELSLIQHFLRIQRGAPFNPVTVRRVDSIVRELLS